MTNPGPATPALRTIFSNELSAAEVERLAVLLEELGEAQQCIGKILRHGYESYNPVVDIQMTNRCELERELGDIYEAINMLCRARDVNQHGVLIRAAEKAKSIKRWLHHQEQKLRFRNLSGAHKKLLTTTSSLKPQKIEHPANF